MRRLESRDPSLGELALARLSVCKGESPGTRMAVQSGPTGALRALARCDEPTPIDGTQPSRLPSEALCLPAHNESQLTAKLQGQDERE